MPLRDAAIDATIEDFYEPTEVEIITNVNDLLVCCNKSTEMTCTIFSIYLNCGKDKEKAIMFDVEIDELEEFASAVLKKIDIVRKNFAEQIKYQTDNGFSV